MRYVPWFLAFLFFALGSLATVVLFLRDFLQDKRKRRDGMALAELFNPKG